eukprot:554786_1
MAAIQFKNILNHPVARCTHVVSNSLSRCQEFLQLNRADSSIIASGDLEATLKQQRDDIDGVVITSSSNHHYDQIKQCLLNETPVFVEKPIAENIAQIDELYTLAAQKKLPPILVGHQRRFDPNIQNMYKEIHENDALLPSTEIEGLTPCIGGIEKIISISRDPCYPEIDYMTTSINGFYDSIIHDIDTICYITKQFPNKVYSAAHAHYKTIAKLNDFDRVFVTLHFESGLLGLIDWCRHSGFAYDQRVNVLGYNGTLEIGNPRKDLLMRHTNDGAQMTYTSEFLERYRDAYRNEIWEFVQVVQGTKEVITTHEDIRNVYTIVAAAERSARSGQLVDIQYNCMTK